MSGAQARIADDVYQAELLRLQTEFVKLKNGCGAPAPESW